MGNADTGKEEDTSEEDTKNAEKYSLLYKFPRVIHAYLIRYRVKYNPGP